MKTNPSLLALLSGLLLAVPPAFAEDIRHPSGFEPAPVFDEAPTRKPFHAKPPQAAKPAPEALHRPVVEPAPVPAEPVPVVKTLPATLTEPQTDPADSNQEARSSLFIDNYPVGLIALALGGFVFWNIRRPECANSPAGVAYKPNADGQTGVARYLNSLETSRPPSGTTPRA